MAWNHADVEMAKALDLYFEEQAALDGKCVVDYVQFDTAYEKVYEDRPAGYAKAIIEPRGGTALVDAIGRGTVELGKKLAKKKEADRPGTVLVVVVTDGGENSSREFSADEVKKMVTEQQDKWNWDYVFLGANMDAVHTGGLYGFKPASSLTYDVTQGETIMAASASLGNYTRTMRGGGNAAFSDEDRKKAVEKS